MYSLYLYFLGLREYCYYSTNSIYYPYSSIFKNAVFDCYPNYQIKIYYSTTKTIVFETKIDSKENFKAFLDPGDYVIYTKAGLYPTIKNQIILLLKKI